MKELDEISEEERWYDEEIAPALLELGRKCRERKMAFIASVEYLPGNRGGTYILTEDSGLEMRMLALMAQTAPNIDGFIISLARYCQEKGIDTGSSIVMGRFSE